MITYKVQERFVKANEDFDEMKIPLKPSSCSRINGRKLKSI